MKKISFVDDEPDLIFIFKEGLERAGLSVDACNNSTLSRTFMIW
jgi:CheY-like chemotaxis protein